VFIIPLLRRRHVYDDRQRRFRSRLGNHATSKNEGRTMRWILVVAATIEAATGLVLIVNPTLLATLVLGNDLSGAGQALGHLAGLVFLSLAIACWPTARNLTPSALHALLFYNLVATLYLVHLGRAGKLLGELLWPAAGLHAVLTILLAYVSLSRTPRQHLFTAQRRP
jgi:hypothetical protein